MSNETPVARVRGLSHHYGATTALTQIDIEIPAGRLVGLIGPDGVGKSTLLGLLSGARRIRSGSVEVLGGDMRRKGVREKRCQRIAYMPQGLGGNLYPSLSVLENVEFFGRLFGVSKAVRQVRIERLLHSTGLEPFAEREAGKLSGGMKQKLGLCCALIHEPDLLILDEPTTGVDPLSRRQFWELIRRGRGRHEGLSVIVATAYMEEADQYDWLIAMDGGAILATGSPERLKERTGTTKLEDAFIRLLPEEKRKDHRKPVVPPRRTVDDGIYAIEANMLSRRFGDFLAVDRVSFRIEPGEIFGFLGSNGCGKTTTMKMLTGLLAPSHGEAYLFGKPVDVHDLTTRERVGFMSQDFSLYKELTVKQNLELHARLFHLPPSRIPHRVSEMVDRFGLGEVVDELADKLPVGIRQRLSLAVAVIHSPELLILDEPTSGVDPIARDRFWQLLAELARRDRVTVFISTHFMDEAERCDRIALMHAGRVLAEGTPSALIANCGCRTLEDAFVAYLELQVGETTRSRAAESEGIDAGAPPDSKKVAAARRGFDLERVWAYASREAKDLRRDHIRLSFAVLGPLILMIVFGYGISFDVENLPYAALDYDQTPESRRLLENFSGSRYFEERSPIGDRRDMERRMQAGEIALVIEVPPGFGRRVKSGRQPEFAVWLDGAMPFRAETARGYVQGIHREYAEDISRHEPSEEPVSLPATIETRFRYNQAVKSVYAIIPGNIMLLLAMIPAMMCSVGVVREKEMGSITNLYVSPVTGWEFLMGKQLPYVVVGFVNFASLVLLALFVFDVPIKGSLMALSVGAGLYVVAMTAVGLLFSTFVKTQIAAIFGTAIVTSLAAVQFSGLLNPVSSLTGGARWIAYGWPSSYFQQISLGTFTKALGLPELTTSIVVLGAFAAGFIVLSRMLLKTQEA